MGYKNPKQLLIDAAKFPAAFEGMLPDAAPKLSTTLVDTAQNLDLPDFPVEIPTLPTPPQTGALRLGGRGSTVRVVEEGRPPVAAVAPTGRTRFLY